MPEENDQNEGIADQQDEQINEQSTDHLSSEHIEHQNEKDLESGIATEESGTLKSHYEISKDQLKYGFCNKSFRKDEPLTS